MFYEYTSISGDRQVVHLTDGKVFNHIIWKGLCLVLYKMTLAHAVLKSLLEQAVISSNVSTKQLSFTINVHTLNFVYIFSF